MIFFKKLARDCSLIDAFLGDSTTRHVGSANQISLGRPRLAVFYTVDYKIFRPVITST